MALKDEILEEIEKNNIPVPNDAIDQDWFVKSLLVAHGKGYDDCETDNPA